MKKLIFTFYIIVCALLSSCNNSNCEITYSSKSCVTLGNIEEWGSEIKSHEFENGLGKITFNGKVKNVPESAFRDCTSLKSITLPNSVTSIRNYAFAFCSRLRSITIPDSVTQIGFCAFGNCSSLKTVYCKPTTPPIGDQYMFNSNPSNLIIYVPRNSVNRYKSAEYWKEYADDIVGYDF